MNPRSTLNNDDTNSAEAQHGGHGVRMGLLMLLCCLAPIVAIVAVSIFGVPLNSILTFVVLLLCPLMMVFMMGGDHGHGASESASVDRPVLRQEKTDIAA